MASLLIVLVAAGAAAGLGVWMSDAQGRGQASASGPPPSSVMRLAGSPLAGEALAGVLEEFEASRAGADVQAQASGSAAATLAACQGAIEVALVVGAIPTRLLETCPDLDRDGQRDPGGSLRWEEVGRAAPVLARGPSNAHCLLLDFTRGQADALWAANAPAIPGPVAEPTLGGPSGGGAEAGRFTWGDLWGDLSAASLEALNPLRTEADVQALNTGPCKTTVGNGDMADDPCGPASPCLLGLPASPEADAVVGLLRIEGPGGVLEAWCEYRLAPACHLAFEAAGNVAAEPADEWPGALAADPDALALAMLPEALPTGLPLASFHGTPPSLAAAGDGTYGPAQPVLLVTAGEPGRDEAALIRFALVPSVNQRIAASAGLLHRGLLTATPAGPGSPVQGPGIDTDGDGVPDTGDNCPTIANPDQLDADSSGLGDACEVDDDDDDDDGIPDASDNCPAVPNPGQANYDFPADPLGDACDSDDDHDGVLDGADRCDPGGPVTPGDLGWTSGPGTDHDGDGCRDAGSEDADDDGDGVPDGSDACSLGLTGWLSGPATDRDGDGCRDATGEDGDDDNDNVLDGADACPLGALGLAAPGQDRDGDGCKNSGPDEDPDDDGDGKSDLADACTGPGSEIGWTTGAATDHDADGCQDADGIDADAQDEDADDDNDGRLDLGADDAAGGAGTNADDGCPAGETGWSSGGASDHDADGCRDAGEDLDDDGDAKPDASDRDPTTATDCSRGVLGPRTYPGNNAAAADTDDDGCFNSEDPDVDGDGLANSSPAEADTDGDGLADDQILPSPETDSDGDGEPNVTDLSPHGA